MATERTKEERLNSLQRRHERMEKELREVCSRQAAVTAELRDAKEAEGLALRGQHMGHEKHRSLATLRQLMATDNELRGHLERKLSELRRRIEDVANGIA